jgi:hypothetical protein
MVDLVEVVVFLMVPEAALILVLELLAKEATAELHQFLQIPALVVVAPAALVLTAQVQAQLELKEKAAMVFSIQSLERQLITPEVVAVVLTTQLVEKVVSVAVATAETQLWQLVTPLLPGLIVVPPKFLVAKVNPDKQILVVVAVAPEMKESQITQELVDQELLSSNT